MRHQQTVRFVYSELVESMRLLEEENAGRAAGRRGGQPAVAGMGRGRESSKSQQAVVAGQLLSLVVGMTLRALDIRELAKAARVVAGSEKDAGNDGKAWAERTLDQVLLSILGRSVYTPAR